jgi:hypothetical protein
MPARLPDRDRRGALASVEVRVRIRHWLIAPLTGVLVITGSAVAHAAPSRISLDATLSCERTGGALVTFTISNRGKSDQRLSSDMHLVLDAVRPGGRKPVRAVFVFPAFGRDLVPAGGQQTFVLPFGTAVPEAGEPGIDLSARRLILDAEVFVAGRDHAIRGTFTFRGCPPTT